LVEHGCHLSRAGNVGLNRRCPSARSLNFLNYRACVRRPSGIVDDDGKPVRRQAPGDGRADAA